MNNFCLLDYLVSGTDHVISCSVRESIYDVRDCFVCSVRTHPGLRFFVGSASQGQEEEGSRLDGSKLGIGL